MKPPNRVPSAGRLFALAVGGLTLGLVLAACGADTESAAPVSSPSVQEPVPDTTKDGGAQQNGGAQVDISNSVLPAVQVKDVAGGDVNLASLVPSQKPILLWAWAPHCTICAGEAPGVEAFSKQYAGQVTVVGIGTQDDLALAEDFVSTYGVSTPQMLWDPGFESWQALEITGQPTWVLLSPGGEEIGRWQGGLPEGQILANL